MHNAKKGYGETTYTLENGKLTDKEGERLKKNGGEKENGTISISEDGDISVSIQNGTWCALKEKTDKKLKITDYKEGNCETSNIEKPST